MRGGALYNADFATRQSGAGPFAALLAARFERAKRAYNLGGELRLDTGRFLPPRPATPQLDLW
jgi:hypothetical protein